MFDNADEELHRAGDDPHWQESFYFNWSDVAADAFGLCRLGWRINEGRADALVVALRDGEVEYVYPGVNQRIANGDLGGKAVDGLRIARLQIQMIEPFERWRITLQGDSSMELVFSAVSPAFDFRSQAEALVGGPVDHAHMEQSGKVTGWTQFRGERVEIDGVGMRDKSWGVRDWSELPGWNWISACFGADLAFEATQMVVEDEAHAMGFVFHDGENHAIETVDVDFAWGEREHLPHAARIEIIDAGGCLLEVHARTRAHAPLYMRGAWIQESQTEFTLVGEGPYRDDGLGVIEHVHRPSVSDTLQRVPEVLPMLKVAQWRL